LKLKKVFMNELAAFNSENAIAKRSSHIAGFASLLFLITTIFLQSFHTGSQELITQIPQNGIDNTNFREMSRLLESISIYRYVTAVLAVIFAVWAVRKGVRWLGLGLLIVSVITALAQFSHLFV